jgi:signal transduction histidine kinase
LYELRLLCPEDRVDILAEALDALDALSVSVEDADAHTEAERALFGEPGMPPPKEGWQRSRVIALFPDEAVAREAAADAVTIDVPDGLQALADSDLLTRAVTNLVRNAIRHTHCKQIHGRRTNESSHEGSSRLLIDGFRRTDLLDHSLVHDNHSLRQGHGFDLIVGDEQGGDAQLTVQFLNFKTRLDAQLGVEIGQGLVE